MRTSFCALVATALLLACAATSVVSQVPDKGPANACKPERALALIAEQLEGNSLLDPKERRVALYCQGAGLLWKHRQDRARAAFQSAYDWASESESEKESAAKNAPGSRNNQFARGDLRLVVIGAIAKYDTGWSRQLTDDLLAEKTARAEKAGNQPDEGEAKSAGQLLDADQASAIKLARHSLASASGRDIADFLVALATRDSRAADALYPEALAVVSRRSVNETLMLYTYPFASVRPIGAESRSSGIWKANEIQPNSALQLQFVELLLQLATHHAEQPIVTKALPDGPYRLSPAARLFLGLSDLEPVVAARFAPLHGKLLQIQQRLADVISEEYMKTVQAMIRAKQAAEKSFNRNLTDAEREKYPGGPDKYYFDAIRDGLDKEPQDHLEKLLEKIFDSTTRKQVGDWLYYSLAQKALSEGRPDDAVKLSDKVGPLDLQAFLAFQIAESALKKSPNQGDRGRARGSLDAAWRSANDADDTNEKAKALLGIANLYLQLDAAQAINALRAAVKTINHVERPDVASGQFTQAIRGKGFAAFTSYSVPGMSLNHAFRELGKADYDAALSAAFGLDNRAHRAEAVFALSAFCLEKTPPLESPGKKKEK